MNVTKRSGSDVPIACSLAGLNGEQRQRQQALNKQLREAIEEIRELPNGYGFRFPAHTSVILAVAEFITLERMCCPFFTFEIEVKSGQSEPLWLRLTGPEGVKQFLRSEFAVK